ncbi:unnamed protein product [Effrenium voratum]|nr:unnamed protein product [Effrenium voratum]
MTAKLIFSVKSETRLGQTTKIVGSHPRMGGWCVDRGMPLATDASTYPLWVCEAELDIAQGQVLEYKFVKVQPDGHVEWEPGNNRILRFDSGEMFSAVGPVGQRESVFGVIDGSGPRLASGSSAPSLEASPKESTPDPKTSLVAAPAMSSPRRSPEVELHFNVVCSDTGFGEYVTVVGSVQELGCWDTGKGLQLRTSAEMFPTWTGKMRLDAAAICGMELKVVIARTGKDVATGMLDVKV